MIKGSDITVGELNSITVPLGHLLLTGTMKTQFAVCVFVEGPNFMNDTLGFIMDANLQDYQTSYDIDIDGSLGSVGGVPMRTYRMTLDAGNLVLDGQQVSVGGGGGFFGADFPQYDPASGDATGLSFNGNMLMTAYISGTSTAGVDSKEAEAYHLENYPNPVSKTTEIHYSLGAASPVTLKIYNTLGEEVSTVVNRTQGAGAQVATFDASKLQNGVYYYKLQAGAYSSTQTMIVNH